MGEFFDVETGGPLRLELRSVDGRDFTLLRAVGYTTPEYADALVVPAGFVTDFASVPDLFTWLVPKSGDFLPAAVLHDALVRPGSHEGPPVRRHEADRIFRTAMIALGTGRVRAWLMWAAVTISTLWASGDLVKRIQLVGLLGLVTLLGTAATLDFFDVWDVVPWMGDRPWPAELALGALFAVLVPSVLAVSWGRYWRAGVIIGVALALLLHVTAALLAIYGLYLVLERIVSGPADEDGVRTRDRRDADAETSLGDR
ncbi:hypothetical protein SGUI_1229 [Serinicoccus hydrothermalis]|uniref:DUF1353 domain-containing protein n=1 Tax=Serinicoccus hydrothermalis TaxID=1758689 RepID=A0A1B1NB69_9MICO|nr:DUF1353 domain-containing protein [Serinicoccus hydrothermalis]ANS78625.1 hypothetical protein SGUI_1229 [Serinicoccus hydrothermalis]